MADNALTRAAAGGGAQPAKKRNALLDFLQSASNAIAQNVSGPVDLIGAGLRFAGVPVPEDAVGSSRWMADRGLTAEVPMGAARVLGETAGMVGPIAGAQFAPQIAAWRNMVNERLAPGAPGKIPTSIPRGAIVWHGSPHKFDAEQLVRLPDGREVYVGGRYNTLKEAPPGATLVRDYPLGRFRSDGIGTGEGAQAYGRGHYLADSSNVSGGYADRLSRVALDEGERHVPRFVTYGANKVRRIDMNAPSGGLSPAETAVTYMNMEGGKYGAMRAIREWIDDPYIEQATKEPYIKALRALDRIDPKKVGTEYGHLYKVDLPDEAIARMLDWDKPLSEQAPEVRAAIAKLPKGWVSDRGMRRFYDPTRTQRSGQGLLQDLQLFNRGTPEAMLREAGIPGIRYLDGGSRSAGQGTSNYVIFPGEENILQILARNGEPLP